MFSPVDSQQRRDPDQQPPPGPVADRQKRADVALHASEERMVCNGDLDLELSSRSFNSPGIEV